MSNEFHIRLPEQIDGEILKSLLDVLAKQGLSVHVYISSYNSEGEVDGIGLRCFRKEEA